MCHICVPSTVKLIFILLIILTLTNIYMISTNDYQLLESLLISTNLSLLFATFIFHRVFPKFSFSLACTNL